MKRLAFAAMAAFLAAPAAAQPPPQGWVGEFSASILCDTREQLQSIVDAFEEGPVAAEERFQELYRRQNDRSEPTCAVAGVVAVASGTTDLGLIEFGGEMAYAWIVRIANDAGEGYYLYLESRTEALKNSI
ncbi:MAG: hypothetical protein ACRED5_19955 [Propylenella sp.]